MTLQQKLSPQQIQMIKLLELPTVQLEQRIKQEIEENIVLEEAEQQNEEEEPQQISVDEYLREDDTPAYKMRANNYSKDDKPRQIPLSGGRSLQEYLIEQLGYRHPSEEEGCQCGVIGQLLTRPCPIKGYKHGRNQSVPGNLLLCDVCLHIAPTKLLTRARESGVATRTRLTYPLLLQQLKITPTVGASLASRHFHAAQFWNVITAINAVCC